MKGIISILIAFLYLVGTMPVFLSFHYCGKHFQYITVNKVEEKKTCCGKNEMPSHGCCSDKTISFDVDDQVPVKAFTFKIPKISIIPTTGHYIPEVKTSDFTHEVFKISHSPPLVSNLRLHVINCSFLI